MSLAWKSALRCEQLQNDDIGFGCQFRGFGHYLYMLKP
jgi:hypothetical protein